MHIEASFLKTLSFDQLIKAALIQNINNKMSDLSSVKLPLLKCFAIYQNQKKIFKNGPTTILTKQSLKRLRFKQTTSFQVFQMLASTNYTWSVLKYFVSFIDWEKTLLLWLSSPPEVFCEKDALTNFAKFTGEHLCQSLFFICDCYHRKLW